jgi:hypothetical protein
MAVLSVESENFDADFHKSTGALVSVGTDNIQALTLFTECVYAP